MPNAKDYIAGEGKATIIAQVIDETENPRYTYKAVASGGDEHLFIGRPQGGEYAEAVNTNTGAIRITLPQYKIGSMISFNVTVYDHLTNSIIIFSIKGYLENAIGVWQKFDSLQTGGSTKYDVVFGNNGTKACIQIGDIATTGFDFLKVTVSDLVVGYLNATYANWATSWSVTREISLPVQVDATVSNWVVSNTNVKDTIGANDGIGSMAFCYYDGTAGTIPYGSTVSGIYLKAASVTDTATSISATAMTGTWKCLGYGVGARATLFTKTA